MALISARRFSYREQGRVANPEASVAGAEEPFRPSAPFPEACVQQVGVPEVLDTCF